MPMDAWRDGDTFQVEFDLPGVDVDSIDLDVERNVVTVRAERPTRAADAELIAAERPRGVFSRQLILGDNLDTQRIAASYDGGVLRLRIPVAEQAKPRKISISSDSNDRQPAGHQRLTAGVTVMPQIRPPDNADATRNADTRSAERQFLDLLLADDELLRAEFDAIIAAEWPGSPPNPPHRRVLGEPDPGGTRRPRVADANVPRPGRRPHVDRSARQRSPPIEDHEKTDNTKGKERGR